MPPAGPAGTVVFLVSAAAFMHVAARFVLGSVALRRSAAVVAALAVTAAGLGATGLPPVLAVLALLVVAVIAIQTVYEVELRDAALVLVVYATVTTLIGVVLRSGLRLL